MHTCCTDCNEGGCKGPHNSNTTGAGFHQVTKKETNQTIVVLFAMRFCTLQTEHLPRQARDKHRGNPLDRAGFHLDQVTEELDGTRPTMGNEEGFNLHGLQQNTDVQGFSHRRGTKPFV